MENVGPRQALLFVCGMHRSGTSALCAALQAGGASFGSELLDPMAGVNDEGFWEDERVVDLNDRLLARQGLAWYSLPERLEPLSWSDAAFDDCRVEADAILAQGFGNATLQAVKDPRFCLTLNFWLERCERQAVEARVCVIERAPHEVAASLERRDGFPLGYGLRLWAAYRGVLEQLLPADALRLDYASLLADTSAAMESLASSLPLAAPVGAEGASPVRAELRHQRAEQGDDPLNASVITDGELPGIIAEIERRYPERQLLVEMASALVARGRELTRIGDSHSHALATITQRDAELKYAVDTVVERDAQIVELDRRLGETGKHLEQALATIDERDTQVAELDRRLAEIGALHSQALAHIEAQNERLQRMFNKLGVGPLLRLMWSRESR